MSAAGPAGADAGPAGRVSRASMAAIRPVAGSGLARCPKALLGDGAADLEYRSWVGYYLRHRPQVLVASAGLVRTGLAMPAAPFRGEFHAAFRMQLSVIMEEG